MKFREFRLQISLITFLLVMAGGLLGQYLYQQTQVIGPLHSQLQAVAGVADVALERSLFGSQTRTQVLVELLPQVPLAPVLGEIQQILQASQGDFAVRVHDHPSEPLLQLFGRMRIAAEEAIATGQFTVLEKRVEELAQTQGVDWELAVDRDFIYITLSRDDSILRRVISRDPGSDKVVVLIEGGGSQWPNG